MEILHSLIYDCFRLLGVGWACFPCGVGLFWYGTLVCVREPNR